MNISNVKILNWIHIRNPAFPYDNSKTNQLIRVKLDNYVFEAENEAIIENDLLDACKILNIYSIKDIHSKNLIKQIQRYRQSRYGRSSVCTVVANNFSNLNLH